jgi:D-xylose 1-dehydrogenase (NADP+, D-xylono-1,5-lactone-forming)
VNDAQRFLRWGVLSTARINEAVLPGLRQSQHNEVVAVASRDPSRARAFAARHGIGTIHASYQSLLEDTSIDCVYIPLPNRMHAEWIEAALARGKHVLCEKPLTSRAGEARRLFGLAHNAGLHLAEAFMYRHHPKTEALRDLVRSGVLGQVHTVRCSFNFWTENPLADIRFDPDLDGGALRDVGSYCVSMANLLLDNSPAHVQALAVPSDTGVAERFYAIMRYDGGAVAQFDCSMRSPLSVLVSVLGDRGEAVVPMPWYSHRPPHEVRLSVVDEPPRAISVPDTSAYFLETENFARVVLGEATPVVTAAETIRNIETLELLASAARLASG